MTITNIADFYSKSRGGSSQTLSISCSGKTRTCWIRCSLKQYGVLKHGTIGFLLIHHLTRPSHHNLYWSEFTANSTCTLRHHLSKSTERYFRRSVDRSILMSGTHLAAHDGIFITVRQLWVCWCEAPSLTRGLVYSLQLLRGLASGVILGYQSSMTHGHIFLTQIEDSPTWGARSQYLYHQETQGPSFSPRHSVSPSPHTPNGKWSSLYIFGMDRAENVSSNNYSIIACYTAVV
jgi:hypothetical protein